MELMCLRNIDSAKKGPTHIRADHWSRSRHVCCKWLPCDCPKCFGRKRRTPNKHQIQGGATGRRQQTLDIWKSNKDMTVKLFPARKVLTYDDDIPIHKHTHITFTAINGYGEEKLCGYPIDQLPKDHWRLKAAEE